MSQYLPPLHINEMFNVLDFNYQYDFISYFNGDQRYVKKEEIKIIVGPIGLTGETGLKGDTGLTGLTGLKGDIGLSGTSMLLTKPTLYSNIFSNVTLNNYDLLKTISFIDLPEGVFMIKFVLDIGFNIGVIDQKEIGRAHV